MPIINPFKNLPSLKVKKAQQTAALKVTDSPYAGRPQATAPASTVQGAALASTLNQAVSPQSNVATFRNLQPATNIPQAPTLTQQAAATPTVAPTLKQPTTAQMFGMTGAEASKKFGVSRGAAAPTPAVPQAPTPTPTAAPPAPTPAPAAPSDTQLQALQSQYLSSLKPSEEEVRLQQQINSLISGRDLGVAGLSGQGRGIPLSLVEGQQGKLMEQAALQAAPLQRQLALLQAQRTASQQAAEKQIGFEKDRLSRETQKQDDSVVIGNSLINRATGEVIYQSPQDIKTSIEKINGRTVLINKETGEVIKDLGGVDAKVTTTYKEIDGKLTKIITDEQGNTISIEPMETTDGTKTITTSTGEVINIGEKQLSPTQATLLAEGRQLSFVLDPLYKIIDKNSNLFDPILGKLGQLNPYYEKAQKIDDDLRRSSQVIGRYMEGGVLRKEDEEKYRRMLPKLTDTSGVAKDKLDGVAELLEKKQREYIESFARAGYDVSGFVDEQSPTQQVSNITGQQFQDWLNSSPVSIRQQAKNLYDSGITDYQDIYNVFNKPIGFNNDLSKSINGSSNASKIAMAIKQVESGGNYQATGASGEYGAYQFMPATWNQWASKYLGNPNAPMTQMNQDIVAQKKIDELLKQGYTAKQIALIWNGGTPVVKKGVNKYGVRYDSGAYSNKVINTLNNLV